jgi:capsid protein
MAILSGKLTVPESEINPMSLKKAGFQGPTMPWIDPQREVTAEEKAVQAGFKSRTQVIRERGGNPQDIFEQIKQEREQESEAGISFTSSLGKQPAPITPKEEPTDDKPAGNTDSND